MLYLILLLAHLAAEARSSALSTPYRNTSTVGTSSVSTAIGGHVAAGLNLQGHSVSTKPSSSGTSSLGTAAADTRIPIGTAISHSAASTNTTLFNAAQSDRCWTEWQSYWNASSSGWTPSGWTQSTTFTTTIVLESYPQTWQTYQFTATTTEMNGHFPVRTYMTVFTTTVLHFTTDPTYTSTAVVTREANPTITPPPCALPSYVPQCQSAWEGWIHSETWASPVCTQASIIGSLCSSVQSYWLLTEGVVGETDGKVGEQVNAMTRSNTTELSTYFPSTSILAPGCSVGCLSCRVSGSHVQLLYWPPATTAYRNGTLHAVTEKANATGIVTAVVRGTTLTSPTVYISFDRLYASDSCSVVGSTVYSTILAITNSATLSSLYGWGRYGGLQQTASFNFTDLYVSPVPQSIYASQPRCASSSTSIVYSCQPYGLTRGPLCSSALEGEFVCATTLPYQPVLAMPAEVRDLQPEWASCLGGLAGVYDPPSALHAAASAAAVTVPKESTAAKTTSQAEVVATTKASPSPKISGAAPATKVSSASAVPEPAIIGSQIFNGEISGVVTDGSSASLYGSMAAPTVHVESPAAVWTVSSQGITAQKDASGFVIQGAGSTATIAQGSETTFARHTISVEANGAVFHVDGSSMTLYSSAAVWTPSAQQNSAHLEQSNIILAGPETTKTIARGSFATFAGQTISADKTGTAIYVDGSSIPLKPTQQHFSYAPETRLVGGLALPSTTLLPGSEAIISGTTYSLPPSNSDNEIYISGQATLLKSEITLPNGLLATPTTVQSLHSSIPSDPTLFPGSATITSGTIYSLASSGNALYINGHSTSVFPLNTPVPPPSMTRISNLPALLVGSQTFFPGGPAVTVSGTTYSADGTSVVVKGPEKTFTRAVTAFDSMGPNETTTREGSTKTTPMTTGGTGNGKVPSETTATAQSGVDVLSPSPVVMTSLLSMLYAAYEIFVILNVHVNV